MVNARNQFALSTTNKNYMCAIRCACGSGWWPTACCRWSPTIEREFAPEADYFVAEEFASPHWATGERIAIIGAHSFYRVN